MAEVWPIGPRLLDVEASAAYLGGVSVWTIRSYIAEGVLVPVVLPGSSGALRRVLLDRVDLDQLVEQGKGGAEAGRKGAG